MEVPTNTTIASQLLFPAVSVPVGMARDTDDSPDSAELPVGMEILTMSWQEEKALAIAAGIEASLRR
jgi:Asp-tRNA(Asn)/Glu-tRNA(Gln) amidotransferase A subunit family amidase